MITSILTQEQELEAMTPETLRNAAKRYLRPDTAWKLETVPHEHKAD